MVELHAVQHPPTEVRRYVAPRTWNEALELVADAAQRGARSRTVVVAGCTDVATELARGAHGAAVTLLDLSRIPRLAGVNLSSVGEGGTGAQTHDEPIVRLGPLTTHADVVAWPDAPSVALPLAQACAEVGSPPLRNRATVVGNVVTASPANDTLSALYALNAQVELASVWGSRRLPIAEFITGYRATALADDELVASISFEPLGAALPTRAPSHTPSATRRGIFVKLGLRAAAAISVAHLAAVVAEDENGAVTDMTLALGSVGPTVLVVSSAAAVAQGRQLADATAEVAQLAADAATPVDDLRAPASYRRSTVATLAERALMALAEGTEAATFGPPSRLRLSIHDEHPTKHPTWQPATTRATPPGTPQPVAAPQPNEGAAQRPTTPTDEVAVTLNGQRRRASGAVGRSLLDWLRDACGVTGPKEGCAEGECGACVVQLDGEAVFSCLVPAARAGGCEVVTVEGATEHNELARTLATAMARTGGTQCGFCTPGFIVSAATLLTANPNPTRDELSEALCGNICRCTGYYSIVEAVEQAATRLSGQGAPA